MQPAYLPPAIRNALVELGLFDAGGLAITNWTMLRRRFRKWCDGTVAPRDQGQDAQDIRRQRLFTYNVHVLEGILTRFARIVWRIPEARQALGQAPLTEGQSLQFWSRLKLMAETANWIDTQWLVKQGLLVRFEPLNGIAAASELTAFQRYDTASSQIERMAAWRRQNHVSFDGLVCPVESPETKKVGVTLHLSGGCRVNAAGELTVAKGLEDDPAARLGHAASLVPFAQHNDGVRCMMGAKNLKQTVPLRTSEPPVVATGNESEIAEELLTPLVAGGVLAEEAALTSPGLNLLVAYLPWYGWNADDAIVAHERLREAMTCEYVEDRFDLVRPGIRPCDPPAPDPWTALQGVLFEDGLRKPGPVQPDGVVAWLRDEATGAAHARHADTDTEAILESIRFVPPFDEGFGSGLAWRIRNRFALGVGDKLMGRHGNKGVVSALLGEDQLPRLPDTEALPPELRGRGVDLILNPNGVVSRMNLGQLIETHIGLLAQFGGEDDLRTLGRPFGFDSGGQRRLRERFVELEERTGGVVDRYGRVKLVLPPSSRIDRAEVVRAVLGFQYFVRLNHIPALKASARRGGAGYRYRLSTGQPVQGRKNRGGQRLGEMEVWALDAHQAKENLREILGPRSHPPSLSALSNEAGTPTFHALRDHLRAVGIALEVEEGAVRMRWLEPEEVRATGREIVSGATWQLASSGVYGCPKCDYRVEDIVGTRRPKRVGGDYPSVYDVIRDRVFGGQPGIEVSGVQREGDDRATACFRARSGRELEVTFAFKKRKRSLTATFAVGDDEFTAYEQVQPEADVFAPGLIASLRLSCPERHASTHLKLLETRTLAWPEPGGVCDPDLVGTADPTDSARIQPGYVRLPFAVPSPFLPPAPVEPPMQGVEHEMVGPYAPDVECLPVLPLRHRHALALTNLAKRQPPVDKLTRFYAHLAYACAAYRLHAGNGDLRRDGTPSDDAKDDAEWQRREVWLARRIRRLVFNIYEQIVGAVPAPGADMRIADGDGRLFGKYGLLRYDGLGRRVDGSGRFVIVPDPTLRPDQCRLAHGALLELLLDYMVEEPATASAIKRALAGIVGDSPETGEAAGSGDATGHEDQNGAKAAEHALPTRSDVWRALTRSGSEVAIDVAEAVRGSVEEFLTSHPDLRLLLNRQPTLHRYNLLAFRPTVPRNVDPAPVLRISPLACGPFNADFDGDEMAVHVARGGTAREELVGMTFGRGTNRLSLADGAPLIQFSQELALGHFLLTSGRTDPEAFRALASEVFGSDCQGCGALVEAARVGNGDPAREWLKHLLIAHGDHALPAIYRLAEAAWTAATRSATSFGWLELVDCATEPDASSEDYQRVNEQLEAKAMRALAKCLNADPDSAGYGLAALVLSGSRGGPQQVRQLLGPRGWLDPGDAPGARPEDFMIASSLAAGMDWDDFFRSSFNARSSIADKKLLVAHAGALTRRLVFACWPWRIGRPDCGAASPRSPQSCADAGATKTVCAACYGDVEAFDGRLPERFPVGLIAAQSIGERGTQLSMQSFHTGQRSMTPATVSAVLDSAEETPLKTKLFGSATAFEDFLTWIRENVTAYAPIDDRHFAIIWLAIHHSADRRLSSAWTMSAGPWGLLAGSHQVPALAFGVGKADDLSHPVARILAGAV